MKTQPSSAPVTTMPSRSPSRTRCACSARI
jgi:hypothetical protein